MPIFQEFMVYKMGPEMTFYMVKGRAFYKGYFYGGYFYNHNNHGSVENGFRN